MKTASWVLLAVMGALMLIVSLLSLNIAYSGSRDEFGQGGPTVDDVRAWNPEVATAIRARRGTAASFAAAYAVLVLAIVLGPYRRGDTWAWWTLLAGAVTLALLLDVRRLKAPAATAPAI